ncbi:unnamed protein product [Rotaria socialis]|uniref:ENT domain-containing protein n=1 Tax=Rotaria socialis TaxID=392032 RepID=A0A820U801_9BILA|nr:unnamed protein product [Rotaria socialis]
MEHDILQRRSAATVKNMGVNSYFQVISAFRAQGDLTENKLTILPVLQNAFGISHERHTAEVKRALYDEQLSDIATSINPSSTTTNWEMEANYTYPTVVHRPPNTKYIQVAEQVLQTTLPITMIQYPQPITTTRLNSDLQKLVHDEVNQDGIKNATHHHQQRQSNNTPKPNFNNTDLNGSKVVRLVRAKQAPKRKSSLDTLIEVVQKELLRVNEQANAISPTKLQTPISTLHRPIISSILPSSHSSSLTSQTAQPFKITRKRGIENFSFPKKSFSLQQRIKSFNGDDNNNDAEQAINVIQAGSENIEEIVRETVDRLVAITLMNNAPFVVNMLTAIPNNDNSTNTESKTLTSALIGNNTLKSQSPLTVSKSDYYRNDLTLLSSTASDIRNSAQQTSPMKQQIHHPQLIIQPTTTSTSSMPTMQGTTTPTLFVAPRILNFQTVVPKPTTNIQIGNTKIILVSPSNIAQHLPHSTSIQTPSNIHSHRHHQQQQQQQQNLVSNSPVKLVKFATATNNNSSITTRPTINTTQASTVALPKNVQIVIPSQTPSTIQLTRAHNDDSNKSISTATFRSVANAPMSLAACTVDSIPQASQEVTISTSPMSSPPLTTSALDHQQQSSLGTTTNVVSSNSNNQSQNNTNSQQQSFPVNPLENNNTNGSTVEKSRRRSSSSASIDKPVGKVLRPITKVLPVYSPNNSHDHATIMDTTSSTLTVQQHPLANVTTVRTSPIHDEMMKSVIVNFQPKPQQMPRPTSTHGPMIYRMTSVNPNVPVFRVRAATTSPSTTVINKSIKTDTKPISVTTAANMCYEPKPAHTTPTTSGSVSVLACFKTTKKRNKERAIMPRPSTIDSNDVSQDFQQRLSTILNTNASLVLNTDMNNSNSSSDYRQQSPSTQTRLVQQTSLSSTYSDDNASNIFSLSMNEQVNDTTTSSSNSIPILRHTTKQLNMNSIQTITTPNISPTMSPIQSLQSTPKTFMADKSIQCINQHKNEFPDNASHAEINYEKPITGNNKRSGDDMESWTVAAESLLHNMLSQHDFHLLDVNCQQILSSKFDLVQANLVNGVLSSRDEFYNSILDIKRNLFNNDLSKVFEDDLEKLFNYFETEFKTICDQHNEHKRMRQQ